MNREPVLYGGSPAARPAAQLLVTADHHPPIHLQSCLPRSCLPRPRHLCRLLARCLPSFATHLTTLASCITVNHASLTLHSLPLTFQTLGLSFTHPQASLPIEPTTRPPSPVLDWTTVFPPFCSSLPAPRTPNMPRRHPLPVDSDSDMETRPPPKRSRAATKSKGQDAEPSSIGRTSSTRNRTTRASNNAAEDDGVATPVEIPSASDQLSGPARRSQRSVSARRSRGNADDADSCPDDGGAAFVPPDEDEEQEEDDDDEVMDVDEEETAPAAARKSRKSRKSRAFKAMDFVRLRGEHRACC